MGPLCSTRNEFISSTPRNIGAVESLDWCGPHWMTNLEGGSSNPRVRNPECHHNQLGLQSIWDPFNKTKSWPYQDSALFTNTIINEVEQINYHLQSTSQKKQCIIVENKKLLYAVIAIQDHFPPKNQMRTIEIS
ncbi:hypothetical protein HELRODRAFT_174150 [Helobdella robusta]|uniref:Uncharacterized protein n=1 Tax=Helobdella robusta TaxID=6412 RepID=T1F7P4_HELRO|nr:hypothetical protein HELRODRAFT_174150 [Helobdella robusta]ESO02745.1 hypothetical protein HELRODRAFT_174150 [Helobdella robusta]